VTQAVPLIEAKGLGVRYRLHRRRTQSLKYRLLQGLMRSRPEEFWALRHVNLTCHEGRALGILGANGAGKSTLCLALSGILEADEGSLTVRGRVSSLLSLSTGFDNQLSGRQNISLSGSFLGMSLGQSRALEREIIEFAELEKFIDEPVRIYSSGMRSRLAFAIATSVQPEILILDEVLSVGDETFKAKSRQRIESIIAGSKLVVVVSHNLLTLSTLCTEGVWVDGGRIVQNGPIDEVIAAYRAATAAAL
jgi:ABC-type polysaccharide/polyol phosphate transport system ATPase subunit